MLCRESIEKLIGIYSGDEKILKTVDRCLASFEDYHTAIVKMETWLLLYSRTVSGAEYQAEVTRLDKARTTAHNSVIGNVSLLNRLAEKNGLPAVYDGTVSREQPYRRELANAVLDYVESIIQNRR